MVIAIFFVPNTRAAILAIQLFSLIYTRTSVVFPNVKNYINCPKRMLCEMWMWLQAARLHQQGDLLDFYDYFGSCAGGELSSFLCNFEHKIFQLWIFKPGN